MFAVAEYWVRQTQPHDDLLAVTGQKKTQSWMQAWAQVDAFSAYRGRTGTYVDGVKTVNRYGFISTPDLPVTRDDPNTLRIVFLGGSSTAGTGGAWGGDLPDRETWPWQVAEALRAKLPGRKVEFINAGLSGYSSFESYGRLWSRIRFFKPDIVVVYHAWNEMYYFNKGDDIVNWRTLPDGSWGFHEEQTRKLYEPLWIDAWIHRSQLLTKARLRLSSQQRGETAESKPLSDHFNPAALDVFRDNMRLIASATQLMGAELFVVKQATLVAADLPIEWQARCRYDFHGFDHRAHVDAFAQVFKILDEEFPADHIIDLTNLSGNPEYFFDHVHPNTIGARKIASGVARGLLIYLANRGKQAN